MKSYNKRFKIAIVVAFIILIIAILGCRLILGKKGDYRIIVDEYASVYLPMDGDGYLYETALDAVGDYLSGNIDYSEALAMVESTIAEMDERLERIEKYTFDTEFDKLLEEYDIIPEEFEAFGNYRATCLLTYIEDLEVLAEHLEYAVVDEYEYKEVVFWHGLLDAFQEVEKGYYYYSCLNYWFASWDEEQLIYIDEKVINELQSYISDSFFWETDREMAELMAMKYMDREEGYISLEAEHLAQVTEDYATLLKELEELEKMIKENEENGIETE